jgi:dihydrodipicolinate synthase/N-acetylneuraminate lyase
MVIMKTLLDLQGIITVLNTPFTHNDEIDVESLRRNVRYALTSGVKGFLVPAMASEVSKLSSEERERMVRIVLDEVNGEVPVIGGASAASQEERLIHAKGLIALGCDGVLVSIAYENDSQYQGDVREIAALQPGFLMLQDWDSNGFGVPIPLIVKLFREIEVFRSLKIEVVPAGVKYTQVLKATEGKLHVTGGWAVNQFIEGLDRGIHAFMPTAMHEIYVTIYNLYCHGKRSEAERLFDQLLPVLAFCNQHLDISIHFLKHLLYKQGIYATARVRQPILPFDEVHEQLAEKHILRVIQLTKTLATTTY